MKLRNSRKKSTFNFGNNFWNLDNLRCIFLLPIGFLNSFSNTTNSKSAIFRGSDGGNEVGPFRLKMVSYRQTAASLTGISISVKGVLIQCGEMYSCHGNSKLLDGRSDFTDPK